MTHDSITKLFRALDEAKVRYLVVGGLAVNAHGFQRFTRDVDLVIDLNPSNLSRALEAFENLGYQPRVPVSLASFADPEMRAMWIREKGMMVFSLLSGDDTDTVVDIFSEEPFPFDEAYRDCFVDQIETGLEVYFVSLDRLIAMKLDAGREQDRIDVEHLEKLRDDFEN